MLEEQIAWTSEHFNWNVCLVYIQPFFVTNLWANSFWRIAPVILQWNGLMFECYLTSKSSLSLACGQAGSSLFSFNFLNIKQCFVFPENNCLILKSNENWKKMIFYNFAVKAISSVLFSNIRNHSRRTKRPAWGVYLFVDLFGNDLAKRVSDQAFFVLFIFRVHEAN